MPVVAVEGSGTGARSAAVGEVVEDFHAREAEFGAGGDTDRGEDGVLAGVLQDAPQTAGKLALQLRPARLVQLQDLVDLGLREARGSGSHDVRQAGIVDESVGSGESGFRRLVAAAGREAHGDGGNEGDSPDPPLDHGLHGGFPSLELMGSPCRIDWKELYL